MQVRQVQIVTVFEPQNDILLDIGSHLKEISKQTGGKLLMLNIPESAPLETPRALVKSKDLVIGIGLNRIEVTILPPTHIANQYNLVCDYIRVRGDQFIANLSKVIQSYLWSGIVSQIDFPISKDGRKATDVITPIYEKIIRIPRKDRKLASFQTLFGYIEGGFNLNYTLSGYETKNIVMPQVPIGQQVKINLDNFPIQESGLQFVLDINNLPTTNKETSLEEFRKILRKHNDSFASALTDLTISDMIKEKV